MFFSNNFNPELRQKTYIPQTLYTHRNKKQQREISLLAASCFFNCFVKKSGQIIIYRGARQKLLISCDPQRDGMPIRDGRLLMPFSRGSRACSLFFCCEAEMFFSLLYICFIVIIHTLGCKITQIFWNNQKIFDFQSQIRCFFVFSL